MDLIESQSSNNEEVLESQPSPILLPSNEQFECVQQSPNIEVVQHLPNHEPSTSLNSIEIHPADLNQKWPLPSDFFKRNKTMNIENFNTWYPLAHHMTTPNMFQFFNRDPSIVFGRTLFQIMKRSSQHVLPPQHPPPYFLHVSNNPERNGSSGNCLPYYKFQRGICLGHTHMILSYTKEWFWIPTTCLAAMFPRINVPCADIGFLY
ncbi:hypothetical protein TNCV_1699341 [Trichonephila clavipes]|nr:hypothetical protein TNCV_1699341 [Trichonephila clavipes]